MVNTLAGITTQTITTPRITTLVRFSGDEKGEVVLFIHGNGIVNLFSLLQILILHVGGTGMIWEEVMVALPANFRGN